MNYGLVSPQACQRQCAHFCSYAELLAIVICGELDGILQSQPLRHEVVVDKVEDTPRQEIRRYVQVTGIACAQAQGVRSEAIVGYVCEGGGEDGGLGGREGRWLAILV